MLSKEDLLKAGMNLSELDEEKKELPRPQTKGEFKVGIKFNPSGSEKVYRLKHIAAEFIDAVEVIQYPEELTDAAPDKMSVLNSEVARLKALAQTAAEEAAMWAVKAATKGK